MSLLLLLLALAGSRLATPPHAARLAALPALLICAYAGLTFPDLDQPLPLDHRSALTHGLLPALALAARPWARAAAAGLAFGIALHLSADIFPDAMTGYATVAVPFAGRLGAGGSYAWLLANALGCLGFGAALLARTLAEPGMRAAAAAGVALLALWYLPRVDGGLIALACLLAAAWQIVRRTGLRALASRATGRP